MDNLEVINITNCKISTTQKYYKMHTKRQRKKKNPQNPGKPYNYAILPVKKKLQIHPHIKIYIWFVFRYTNSCLSP